MTKSQRGSIPQAISLIHAKLLYSYRSLLVESDTEKSCSRRTCCICFSTSAFQRCEASRLSKSARLPACKIKLNPRRKRIREYPSQPHSRSWSGKSFLPISTYIKIKQQRDSSGILITSCKSWRFSLGWTA